jgi:RNA polymerase sigma-70 factor (ECF subfamily)
MDDATTTEPAPAPEVVAALVANHREFLRFVEKRTGNRALAEEILQDAFVRSLGRTDEIEESAVGWFYRVLRNAVVDHQRRQQVAHRRLDAFAGELATQGNGEDELARTVCACVARLAAGLKPEYAHALRHIDVEGLAVKDYAVTAGISASNAGVRVFRARAALKKAMAASCGTCAEHGCYDCSCESSSACST